MHKLYLQPAPRYSEDIDLVQIKAGPIKPIMQQLEKVIDFFEEDRMTEVRGHGAKVLYRFVSEYEEVRMRVKLEINAAGHPVAMKYHSSGAGILSSMVEADGLVELDEDTDRLEQGMMVPFLPFNEVTGR